MTTTELLSKANDYASAALVVTVAVSSVIRVLKWDDRPWAKRILALCFDVGGAIMGAQKAAASEEK